MTSVALTEETATEIILNLDYRAVTMERVIVLIFFCIAVEGDIGKHIHISRSLNWTDAQAHCRRYYTDLTYFNRQSDIGKLRKDTGEKIYKGWIGLHRDPNNYTVWLWSGGGHMTYKNWANNQPNYHGRYQNDTVIQSDGKWNDLDGRDSYHVYCMDVTVVEEKMSWEDALSRCREKQTHLISLISDTDLLLAQAEIKKITDRVWIGLRFLGDRWMWVNGDPLEYEAWSQEGGQDHQCPIRKRCGALTKEELWENRDCEEKLYFICA